MSPGNRCRVLDVSGRSQTSSQTSPSVKVFSSQQCPCHRKSLVLMSCVLFSLVYNSSAPRSLTLYLASSVITVSSSTIIRANSAQTVTFYLGLDLFSWYNNGPVVAVISVHSYSENIQSAMSVHFLHTAQASWWSATYRFDGLFAEGMSWL